MKYRVALRVLGAAALLGGAVAIAAPQQADPVMADVKEMGLLASAVPVTDVNRAMKFYTEGMGMIALDKGPMAAPRNAPQVSCRRPPHDFDEGARRHGADATQFVQ